MRLLVIRHAQPIDESQTGGIGDPALSPLGHRQAHALKEILREEPIDHIVSSPMLRARQTAEPMARHLDHEIELIDDLREPGEGPYLRGEEHFRTFIQKLAANPDYFYEPEGRAPFTERVIRSFVEVAESNPDRTVAVYCHGMVTATLLGWVMGVEPQGAMFQQDYTGLA